MLNIEKKQRKYHWFLLSFAVPTVGTMNYVSIFTNSIKKQMTMPMLASAKLANRLSGEAALLNVSYLGHMTKDELNPPPPEPKQVIETTREYAQGMVAGIQYSTASTKGPHNPYKVEGEEELSPQAVDWFDGFAAGQMHRTAVEYGED